jgi:hypothetical protein
VNGILADANCAGHLALLLTLVQEGWRRDVWEFLHLARVAFADLGLQPDASDREVWEVCQRAQVILLTAAYPRLIFEGLFACVLAQLSVALHLVILWFSWYGPSYGSNTI